VDERQGETFAEMVDEAAIRLDYNDYQLAGAVGLLPGKKVISSKQIGRLRAGQMRNYPRALVARLIEILELDPIRAWKAADRWPEGIEPGDLPDLSERAAARAEAARRAAFEGAAASASPLASDQAVRTNGAWRVSAGQVPVPRPRAA
jgi:hypothetical protein